MKILYITNYYSLRNSSAAVRNNALVKGLIENGHEVDVLTVRHSNFSTSPDLKEGHIIYSELFNLSLRNNVKGKIGNGFLKKQLVKLYESYNKLFHFPDSYYNWPNIVNPSDFVNYDMMISSSDGKISHFVGSKLKEALSLFWIQIWGDPWMTDINSTCIDKIRIPRHEQKLLSKSDNIVYVSKVTADLMKATFTKFANKIYYIPRSYYKVSDTLMPSASNEIHILYAGMISATRWQAMFTLLKTVSLINKRWQGKVIVDIYGKIDEAAQQKFSQFDCVRMHSLVDADKILELYSQTHILLYISNVKGSSQIPGKLFDYMGVNRPVFCIVDDAKEETSVFLNSFKEKCYVAENSEEEVKEKLNHLLGLISYGKTWSINSDYSPKEIGSKVCSLHEY